MKNRTIFSITLILLLFSLMSKAWSGGTEKHYNYTNIIKKFIDNPTWSGVKRIFEGMKHGESIVDMKNDRRDERGYFYHQVSGIEDSKDTAILLFAVTGSLKKVEHAVFLFEWDFEGDGESNDSTGRTVNKVFAVEILRNHKKHFNEAGLEVLATKGMMVPEQLIIGYHLRFGEKTFRLLIEHDGSGMDIDLEGSDSGYVKMTVYP